MMKVKMKVMMELKMNSKRWNKVKVMIERGKDEDR